MTNYERQVNESSNSDPLPPQTGEGQPILTALALAASIAAGPTYAVPPAQAEYVTCVAHRESNDHTDSVNRANGYFGLFQFSEPLKDGATWMMLDWIRTWHPHPLRFAKQLRAAPMNHWPRNLQVAAFVETLNDGGAWSGARHWAGGRWHCAVAS